MPNMEEKAVDYFMQGFSCSESILRAAYDCEYIDQSVNIELLNQIASPFSGGMGESGCLCGAVAGAQMALGATFGRKDSSTNPKNIKAIAHSFIKRFKEKRSVTCCKVLTNDFEFHSPDRKSHCTIIVKDVAQLLTNHFKEYSLSANKLS